MTGTRNVWYKGLQSLRNPSPHTFGERDFRKPPLLVETLEFRDRIWSIPCALSKNEVVFGSWENAIHCVSLTETREIWRLSVDGPVYSSPVAVGDGTFVVGSEDHHLRRVSAQGSVIWSFQSGGQFHSTPLVDTGRGIVYAGSYDQNVYALNLENGSCIWRKAFPSKEIDQIYSSPSLSHDGSIIFAAENTIVCLGPEGTCRWQTPTDFLIEGTAGLCFQENSGLVGTDGGGLIYLFNLDSGRLLAEHKTEGAVNSCPAISTSGIGCVGSDNGFVYGISMRDGRVLWKTLIGGGFRYTPFTIVSDDLALFVGIDEQIHCLDIATGEPLWNLKPEQGVHSAPLVTADGWLVAGSHRNALFLYSWDEKGLSDAL
ncbi:outer membrane protein assembly factor BamB family protein [Agrobacterium sp. 22-226-1]